MMKQFPLRNKESGSAIIWILIAVSLFAALSYAISSSSQTSTSMITDEQAKAYANQIIAYGSAVKSAVKRLQLRGCKDTEISFENNVVAGYANPNAPSNKSCHVFDVAGGGVSWNQPNSSWINRNFSSSNLYNKWITSGRPIVPGIGKNTCGGGTGNCSELSIFLPYVTKEICIKINETLGVNNPSGEPFNETTGICLYDTNKFVGSYGAGSCGIDNGAVTGKKAACLKTFMASPSTNGYIFYTVLIARE